jgi:hypothetical protein
MMKNKYTRFLFNAAAVILPILILFEVLYRIGYKPLYTNSVSFDAKTTYLEEKNLGQTNLMIIGSSITLNDVSSKVVEDSLHISFFNFSAWGLQINDTKFLLDTYLPKYKPRYVLICSSLPDFTTTGNVESISNYINTKDVIKKKFGEYFYIKNYNSLFDIYTRKKELQKNGISNDNYASLKFDDYGGVLLNIPKKNIWPGRWNETRHFPTKFTGSQYVALNELAALLQQRNIKLIFIQTPVRGAYINLPGALAVITSHTDTCKAIIEKHNGLYLNYVNTVLSNNNQMFVDQFHLSEQGADYFTKMFIHQLLPLIKS